MMFIYFTDTDPVYLIQSSSGAEMISSKHVIKKKHWYGEIRNNLTYLCSQQTLF